MGLAWDDRLAAAVDRADDALQSGRPPPFTAAELVTAMYAMRSDAEPLAWMLADMLIATLLKWGFAVPLLLGERYGPAFKTSGGRGRVRPSEPAFARAVYLALVEAAAAAVRTAGDIARRAETLRAAAPRSGRKAPVPSSKRCLTGTPSQRRCPGTSLLRWAATRLFDRLEGFGAVRELSGRSSFRIYGL